MPQQFCDRSPCTPLLQALGTVVFGSYEGRYYIRAQKLPDDDHKLVELRYCPFCGTRLSELDVRGNGSVEVTH